MVWRVRACLPILLALHQPVPRWRKRWWGLCICRPGLRVPPPHPQAHAHPTRARQRAPAPLTHS